MPRGRKMKKGKYSKGKHGMYAYDYIKPKYGTISDR